MSLSDEKLAKLREDFPCYKCNGTEWHECNYCAHGIDWPAAYEAQGKELERIRATIDVRAAEIIEDTLEELRRRTDGRTAHRAR